MKYPFRIIIAILCLLCAGFPALLSASSVRINEILYDPAESPEYLHEWVELFNPGPADEELTGWKFRVGKTSRSFSSGTGGSLGMPAGSFAVIVSSGHAFASFHLDFDGLILEYGKQVYLSNAGKSIALIDDSGSIVDGLSYDPAFNDGVEGYSIERTDVFGTSDDPANWHRSAEPGGTPGRPNSSGVNDDTDAGSQDDADSGTDGTDDGTGDTADDTEGGNEGPGTEPEDDPDLLLTAGAYPAVITEAAVSESGGKDWIEIFILESCDGSGLTVYERETLIQSFPPVILSPGDVLVIHCNAAGTDETVDRNNNGYLDLYSVDTGLTGTDNVISIRETGGRIVDAVIYSNRDGLTFVPTASYDACVSAGVWKPIVTSGTAADYEAGSIDWSDGGAGYSLVRLRDADGYPDASLPAAKEQWTVSRYPSPGGGYGRSTGSYSRVIDVADPNPFSPDDPDPDKRFSKIRFRVPQGAVKTIRLFDVHGRERVKLVDHDQEAGGRSWQGIDEGIVLWDGRDRNGEILKIGIYIVFLEATNPVTGAVHQGKDTVVIGKQLD